MRLLVDADDVIFNWGKRYDDGLDAIQEAAYIAGDINTVLAIAGIPRSREHTQWDLFADLEPEQVDVVRSVLNKPGFYAELEPFPGVVSAMRAMVDAGHEVFIVTAPMTTNPTCASDKFAAIERHLGPEWLKRIVITSDKTIVHGDVLFDDRGDIRGAMTPTWKQVLIAMPHNYGSPLPTVSGLILWESALEGLR